jgi:2-deoxy-D-gluconate 3-dehydrogenase
MDLFNLKDRVAVVTGGNGGIGQGIARGLAAAGSSMVIAARNEQKTAAAVEEIQRQFGVPSVGIQVDVRDELQVREMIRGALDRFGRIDVLVNNAGVAIWKRPERFETSEWDEIMNINLRGAFFCCKAVYPVMKEAGGGKIINTASVSSILGSAKLAPYSASKGGMLQLTRSLAGAWARDNIQVNALLPGWVLTEMSGDAGKDPEFSKQVVARIPAGRWAEPADLAGAAVFLASQASNYVTGVGLPVDGGLSAMV